MLRSTRTVIVLGIAVQLIAFLRTAIIAASLGASRDVDAYNLGLIAPTLISTVIGSWLQIGFIGRYTALIVTDQTDLAAAYRTRMLFLVSGCAATFAGLCFVSPEPIMRIFMPKGQTAEIVLAASVLYLAGFTLVPIILGDFIGLILNSHGRFFAAALAPLVNAAVSVAGLWLWPSLDVSALVWTLLLGSLAQCLVVVVALNQMQLRFPISTIAARKEVHTTLLLALPLIPAVMLGNSAVAIIQFRCSEFGEGAVALFGYASRLHNALAQVLVIGLGTVLLPHFAALSSRGENAEILNLFRRLVRGALLVTTYLSVGIYLMGDVTVNLLFSRGAFHAGVGQQVSWFWTLLSVGLFFWTTGTFIAKFCQARREAGNTLISGIISFATVWAVAWLGSKVSNLSIVVGAVAASATTVTCFWFFWLSKRIPVAPMLTDVVIGSFRTVLLLLPAALVERAASTYTQSLSSLIDLLIRGSLFSATALLLLVVTGSHRWFFSRSPGSDRLIIRAV